MIQVANTIPEFHLANLNNGYAIRFWIEVPKDYFADASSRAQTPEGREQAVKNENAAKKEFRDKMNEFLAGAENAGRAVFSEYEVNRQLGKDYPGVKIHTLDYDLKGDEMLKLYMAALQTLTASQGIHPTLANVDTQGKLSSGSEMRNAHMVYLKTKTPETRAILLEAIDLLQQEMGWDETIKFEFKDVEITKLDDEKAGFVDNTQMPPKAEE
jgi:phage I-like protein